MGTTIASGRVNPRYPTYFLLENGCDSEKPDSGTEFTISLNGENNNAFTAYRPPPQVPPILLKTLKRI
jgi:hypothetical protein